MEIWLELENKKIKVNAQWLQQQLWVHLDGKTFVVESGNDKKTGSRKATSAPSDKVKAPMPGKITKIFIKPGDATKKGQALVVMEAMKMEYTLKAEIDGTIKQVEIQVGDQVPLGKTLIQIDPGN